MNAKKEYDFSNAKQGAVVEMPANKTRITIRLDNDLIELLQHLSLEDQLRLIGNISIGLQKQMSA